MFNVQLLFKNKNVSIDQLKHGIIYLHKLLSKLGNVGHVENKVDGGIYHQHKMTKIYAVLNMYVGFANAFSSSSFKQAYQLVYISYNREKLAKHKCYNHSKQNFCLLTDLTS